MWDWAACSSPICSQAGSTATQRFCKLGRQPMNPKITEHHRSKTAYVYVRQSTLAQVRHHQESTERQYAPAGESAGTGLERAGDPHSRPGSGDVGGADNGAGRLQDTGGGGLDGPGGRGSCVRGLTVGGREFVQLCLARCSCTSANAGVLLEMCA